MPRFWVATPGGVPRSEVGSAPGQIPRYGEDGRLQGSVTDRAYLTEQGLTGTSTDQYQLYRQLLYQGILDGREITGLQALLLDVFGSTELVGPANSAQIVPAEHVARLPVSETKRNTARYGTYTYQIKDWAGYRLDAAASDRLLTQWWVDWRRETGSNPAPCRFFVTSAAAGGVPDFGQVLWSVERVAPASAELLYLEPNIIVPAGQRVFMLWECPAQDNASGIYRGASVPTGGHFVEQLYPSGPSNREWTFGYTTVTRQTESVELRTLRKDLGITVTGARVYLTARSYGHGSVPLAGVQLSTDGGATWASGTLAGQQPDPRLTDFTEYALDFDLAGYQVEMRVSLTSTGTAARAEIAAYGILLR